MTDQIRSYLRSFDCEGGEMSESQAVEGGYYVRTSDYLLCRKELEAEIARLREGAALRRNVQASEK